MALFTVVYDKESPNSRSRLSSLDCILDICSQDCVFQISIPKIVYFRYLFPGLCFLDIYSQDCSFQVTIPKIVYFRYLFPWLCISDIYSHWVVSRISCVLRTLPLLCLQYQWQTGTVHLRLYQSDQSESDRYQGWHTHTVFISCECTIIVFVGLWHEKWIRNWMMKCRQGTTKITFNLCC